MFFLQLKNGDRSMHLVQLMIVLIVGNDVLMLRAAGSGGGGVVAAIASGGNIVIVLPFVCRYDCFRIFRCPLNMLANGASGIGALVITPANYRKHQKFLSTVK